MPCSWAHWQLIRGLNDIDLTLINVKERWNKYVCVISPRSSIHHLNTQPQCPVCSLFYFHTWKADVLDKNNLLSLLLPPLFLCALSFSQCLNSLIQSWQNNANISFLCSLSLSVSSYYLTPCTLSL